MTSQPNSLPLALRLALGCLPLAFFAACGGGEKPTVDCNSTMTIPKFADVAILKTCTTCHSSMLSGAARQNAPKDVNYDTYDAAKKNADDGVEQVYAKKMPYPSGQGVSEEARQQFYLWAMCGTPQ